MNEKASGILLHITSLPSQFGIGDLGQPCFEFVDFLSEANQKYWQVLPLNPTELTYGNSPYSCPSSYAGNHLLISLESLIEDGYLSGKDLINEPGYPKDRVEYSGVTKYKTEILKKAYSVNKNAITNDSELKEFCADNAHWLSDYSIYAAYKEKHNSTVWRDFPLEIRDRDPDSLAEFAQSEESAVGFYKFIQFVFFKQWANLKKYANRKGLQIIGDLPYYINYDSSDVWANQEVFKLDDSKGPKFVAGVPPDYFSKTGQLWGNPVYDWEEMKETEYSWWINRIAHNLSMFDKLRLDHFRGFVSYWEIKAGEKSALNGKWVELEAYNFLDKLFRHFEKSKFIAEDLGIITQDVKEVVKQYDLPGMKILLFAFGDDFPNGEYLPSNINSNCLIYTGTHDNNTVIGWWNGEASDIEKKRVREYIGKELDERSINWVFIKLALGSRADIAIIPMQDLIGLGESSRMNTPSTTQGNWEWALREEHLNTDLAIKLKQLTEQCGRAL